MPDAKAAQLISLDIREAHFQYARWITETYCGKAEAEAAESRYRQVASGGMPDQMTEASIPESMATGRKVGIVELLRHLGAAASNSEARRSISGRGVRINGGTVEDPSLLVDLSTPVTVQVGKGRFYHVYLS